MIPHRFVIEYPQRCLALLDRLAPEAEGMDLTGTFAVMLASSMLTVPFERLQARHPMHDGYDELAEALRQFAKMRWADAEILRDAAPSEWKFARIVNNPNEVSAWRDAEGRPTMSPEANTIERRRVSEVLRVLRNALAHGNIVYLNAEGYEVAGTRVEYLGFLSRFEESEAQRAETETYRVVAVREAHFLSFVRAWAGWVAAFETNDDLRSD